jgi:hypothetical protein
MWVATIVILLPIGPLQAGGEPPASEEEKGPVTCLDAPRSGSGNSISGKNEADQAAAKSGSCDRQADESQATPPKESLFKRILRVLYGPNTPPGPNTDVDTNISAGGAAGG